MTPQQTATRAQWLMIAAGFLALASCFVAMGLATDGRIGFALFWIGVALVNVYLYWQNLVIYRQTSNT